MLRIQRLWQSCQDLRCLQIQLFSSLVAKELSKKFDVTYQRKRNPTENTICLDESFSLIWIHRNINTSEIAK